MKLEAERDLNRARSLLKGYVYLLSTLLQEHLRLKSNLKDLKKVVNANKKRAKVDDNVPQAAQDAEKQKVLLEAIHE